MKIIGFILLSAIYLAKGNAVGDYSENLVGEQEFRKSAILSEYLFQYIQNNTKNLLNNYVATVEDPPTLPEIQKPTVDIDGVESLNNNAPQLPANTGMVSDKEPLIMPQYGNNFWPASLTIGNSIFRPRPPVQANSEANQAIVTMPAINGPSLLNSSLVYPLEPPNASNVFEVPALPLQSESSTIKLPSPPTPKPTANSKFPASPPPAPPNGSSTTLKLPVPPPSKPSAATSVEVITPPSSSTSNRPVPPKSGLESLLTQLSPEMLEQLLAYVKNG